MEKRGLERYAPLAGLAFVVLAAVSIIFSSEPPAADDSTADVLSYWAENDSDEIAAAIIGSLAILLFVWFAGSLRAALWEREGGSGRLATLGFAGAVIGAAGVLVGNSFEFAAADTVGDVPPEVTQTLSVLYADVFFAIAIGLMLFFLASGIAVVRYGLLPAWLGWVAIVAALLFPTPLFFVPLLVLILWVAIVSVMLFRQDRPAAPPPAAETPIG
jgi:hypothetical protein